MHFTTILEETADKAFGVTTIDQIIIDWFNNLFHGNGWGNLILIFLSLFVATLLAGIIGFEREYHGHAAGLRTHILVALGSALIAVISIYGFGDASVIGSRDPARLMAQVVTGIGFLGAGTIIQTGTDIKGLTTATTIWFVMAIGLASGAGRFVIAIAATIIALVILISLRRIESYTAKKSPKIIMVIEGDKPVLKETLFITNRFGLSVKDIQTSVVIMQGEKCLRISIAFHNAKLASVRSCSDEIRSTLSPIEITVR